MIQFDTLDSTKRLRDDDDVPLPPPSSPEQRLKAFVDNSAPSAFPSEMFENASASFACDFKKNKQVDLTCPRETVSEATLFIKGKDDVEEIAPNDVKQRGIGDCGLQATLRALAATPEGRARLKSMISEGTSSDGKPVYQVTFRLPTSIDEQRRGAPRWTSKVVEIPKEFIKGHAAVGDVDNGKQEVWPLVIEAGFAELKGSYNNINGIWAGEAFSMLTGKHAETFDLGGPKSDFSPILEANKAGLPVTVHFPDSEEGYRTSQGMYANHEYVVTGTEIKDHELCVKLENPWGYDDPQLVPVHELEKRHARVTVGQLP